MLENFLMLGSIIYYGWCFSWIYTNGSPFIIETPEFPACDMNDPSDYLFNIVPLEGTGEFASFLFI
jgi:hypothetical protein